MIERTWSAAVPEKLAVRFLDRNIVDARVAPSHESVFSTDVRSLYLFYPLPVTRYPQNLKDAVGGRSMT